MAPCSSRTHRTPRGLWVIVAVSLTVAGCGRGGDRPPTTGAPGTTPDSSATSDQPGQTTAGGTPVRTIQVVDVLPHRTDAFTQGLELDGAVLYEGTGRAGRSTLAAIDVGTGEVLRSVDVPGESFGEGLTRVGDRLIQLTWQDGVAFVWDAESLELFGEYTYRGEGWGLCHDGERLVMSDGSAQLTFRDAGSFDPTGSVTVTLDGEPVPQLNELECVEDRVYANVWRTDTIMEIDPDSGEVTTVIDAGELRTSLDPLPTDQEAVLNGIAHDAAEGTFWLTGKLWPQLFEVRFVERIG